MKIAVGLFIINLIQVSCALQEGTWKEVENLLQQAKEMEKEQIIEAFKEGVEYWNGDEWKLIDIEDYYIKTFKSE